MSIQLEHVHKSYDSQPVVRDVSLEIETGELFVLLGASGSGKSTLLRLIAGLAELDGGSILLNGRDVSTLPPQQRGTGFVFQNYSLFRHMSVAQNIAFGLSIRKVETAQRRARVRELLELIELTEYGDRLPHQLSGGQQQRVALARALAYEPNVLLLDEPFGALDVKIRGQLRQNLREIQQRLGVTTILVTHDQEEAFEVADRIGVIDGGRLLEIGTPSDLYHHPQHSFTASFLGTANLLHARRNGSVVYVGDVELPAPSNTQHLSGKDVYLLARPEDLALATTPDANGGRVIGRGKVDSVTFAGSNLRVSVTPIANTVFPERLQSTLSRLEASDLGVAPGTDVWISLKSFHLIAKGAAQER
jgi:ABC-type Fe3+/spermidine/putrescine transport system ATPase subunit